MIACILFIVFFSFSHICHAYPLQLSFDSSIFSKYPQAHPEINSLNDYPATITQNNSSDGTWRYLIDNSLFFSSIRIGISSYSPQQIQFFPFYIYKSFNDKSLTNIHISAPLQSKVADAGPFFSDKDITQENSISYLIDYYQSLSNAYHMVKSYYSISQMPIIPLARDEVIVVFNYIKVQNQLASKLIFGSEPHEINYACRWLDEALRYHKEKFNEALHGKGEIQYRTLIKCKNTLKGTFSEKAWNAIEHTKDLNKKATLYAEYYKYMRDNITQEEYKALNELNGTKSTFPIGLRWSIILGSYADTLSVLIKNNCSIVNEDGIRFNVKDKQNLNSSINWLINEINYSLSNDEEPDAKKIFNRYLKWFTTNTNYTDSSS